MKQKKLELPMPKPVKSGAKLPKAMKGKMPQMLSSGMKMPKSASGRGGGGKKGY